MNGTFLLRFDVELAWGFIGPSEISDWQLKAVQKVREILSPLLKLIRDYDVAATWTIVGHLFLDHCRFAGRPHTDMPRPSYSWFEGDWYKYDPCSHVGSAPLWYGKDIVERILDFANHNSTEQEIGCHSFSHQIFGDPGCSRELANAEVEKSLEIMKDYEIYPKTFVFPFGSVGHEDLLKEKGFAAFCSGIPGLITWQSLERSAINTSRKYLSLVVKFSSYRLHLPPPVVTPKQVALGLWDIPGSMSFNRKRGVPLELVALKAKKGVRRAINEKKCFHMFSHLHNFGVDSASCLASFEDVISFADNERRKGRLHITTVREFVKTLEN